jgi:hypothetical protein
MSLDLIMERNIQIDMNIEHNVKNPNNKVEPVDLIVIEPFY